MSVGGQIALLEKALRDLIRDWERYFAGDLRVPPLDAQERIERRLRTITQQPSRQRAERFHVEQLQHRFTAYMQNWNRMLRAREEGRVRQAPPAEGGRTRTRPPNAASAASVSPGEEPALYDRYVAAKQAQGERVGLDRQAFDEHVAAERAKLSKRLGGNVQLDVLVTDGKVRLAARKGPAAKREE